MLKANSAEGQSLKRYALPVFTKQFALKKTSVSKATAYVCGLGQYELFINGEKVGRNFLDPGAYTEGAVLCKQSEQAQAPLCSAVFRCVRFFYRCQIHRKYPENGVFSLVGAKSEFAVT